MLTSLAVASLALALAVTDRPPKPDYYLYPAPTFTLDGGTLVVHNASIAYFHSDRMGQVDRSVDLERGIVLMNMEYLAIPYHSGSDIVWSLDPGTYEVIAGSIDIGDERYWSRGARWTVVVPGPSRMERLTALLARLIEIRAEIRSLAPTDDDLWEALESVDMP